MLFHCCTLVTLLVGTAGEEFVPLPRAAICVVLCLQDSRRYMHGQAPSYPAEKGGRRDALGILLRYLPPHKQDQISSKLQLSFFPECSHCSARVALCLLHASVCIAPVPILSVCLY